jgi:hypothetical protein
MGWFDDSVSWVSEAADTVGDKISAVQDSVVHAVTHPAETYDKASTAVVEAATATADYVSENGVLGTLADGARGVGFAAQGVASGLGSGIASIGDLAVNAGYNWTTRHAINAFRDEPLESYKSNLSDRAGNALKFFEPKNDFERAMMSGGQVVGEVGAFVALTVATAGVGGAAIGATAAAARGTTVGARAITALTTSAETLATGGRISQTFGKAVQGTSNVLANGNTVSTAVNAATGTAKMLNPLASNVALGIETGLGTYKAGEIFDTDKNDQQSAEDMILNRSEQDTLSVKEKHDYIQDKDQLLQAETAGMTQTITQYKNGQIELTSEEYSALKDRHQELKQASENLEELGSNTISPEREAELRGYLDKTLPDPKEQAALGQDDISLDDINRAPLISMSSDTNLTENLQADRAQLTKQPTLNV